MICACLVPVRIAMAFGAFGSADVSGEDCGVEARSSFALRRLVIAFATTGSMPNRRKTGLSGDQRGAMTVAGLAPKGLVAAQISLDLLEPAACDHRGHSLLCSSAMQALGQRHRQIVRPRRRSAEDDGLGISEFGHLCLRLWDVWDVWDDQSLSAIAAATAKC